MSKYLSTTVPQYSAPEEHSTILAAFLDQLMDSTKVEISTGYFSKSSLEELDRLIHLPGCKVKEVTILLGMYLYDGMAESDYHFARMMNQKWKSENIGEIRFPLAGTNHEKVILFYRGKGIKAVSHAGIMGSANLSFLKSNADNRKQLETAVLFDKSTGQSDGEIVNAFEAKMQEIMSKSQEFESAEIRLNREPNQALANIESVLEQTQSEVDHIKKSCVGESFYIPLKVPYESEKFSGVRAACTKSNLNVCYAEPRNKKAKKAKPRDWYEMQLHVPSEIRKHPDYPDDGSVFMIVTDDGYKFTAHAESDHFKQLAAVGNEHILGRWLKGRLRAAGLVNSVDDPYNNDKNKEAMITKEILQEFGADKLLLRKTNRKETEGDGTELEVWYLSFDPKEVNQE